MSLIGDPAAAPCVRIPVFADCSQGVICGPGFAPRSQRRSRDLCGRCPCCSSERPGEGGLGQQSAAFPRH